jgi:hypothetical protein
MYTFHLQICRKFESFSGQNFDFQNVPQKCATCNTPNSAIYRIIWELEEEFTTNKAVLKHQLKHSCINHGTFIEFKLIVSTNSTVFQPLLIPQSENISAANGRVVAPFCISDHVNSKNLLCTLVM